MHDCRMTILQLIFQAARKHAEEFKKVPKLMEDDDMLDDEVIKVNKKECEGRQFHSILISGD